MAAYSFTTETIAIQSKQKYEELSTLFARTVELHSSGMLTVKAVALLDDEMNHLIKKLFNINVMCSLGTNASEAYAIVEPVNTRHVFNAAEYKALMDSKEYSVSATSALALLSQGKEGIVDLKNARLDGAFADALSYVVIDVPSLMGLGIVTPSQLTAILLHEIGHIFTYFTYCANTASVNQVLMGYVTSAHDPESTMRRLSYQLLDGTRLDVKTLKALSSTNNRFIFSWRLSKALYAHHASHASHSIYDNTAAESMADNFTARCGYGGDLVNALVALMSSKGRKPDLSVVVSSDLSLSSMSIIRILSTNLWTNKVNTPITRLVAKVASLFIQVGTTTNLMAMNVTSALSRKKVPESFYPPGTLRYDSLAQRILRVRQLVVYSLKGPVTPAHKLILDELAVIDAQLPPKEMWDTFSPVSKWVNLLLLDEDKNQILIEQSLANIVSNNLLIASSASLTKLDSL